MDPFLFEKLVAAEDALRANLHRHDLDAVAQAHLERALAHVREAFIASNEIGKARSVQRLVGDLEKADLILEKVRERLRPGGGIHI